MLQWALVVLGGFFCALNAYLSWLRYPLHRLRGRRPEEYRHASGAPVVGSLFLLIGWYGGARGDGDLDGLVWVLAAVDTGGLHWFLISMALQGARGADT